MADGQAQNITISKDPASGLPPYLDFDKLRSESIAYLGRLAGKIWTDHNVHDPGITTLEALCYAVLDLGYRTNLPPEDIFAPDPENKKAETTFFTPAQILTCNPLTITDFRKLLIDIDGVNNAWLEAATDVDIEKLCEKNRTGHLNESCNQKRGRIKQQNSKAVTYANGLYHVYIDVEKKYIDQAEQDKFEQSVAREIRDTLISHRNICEDFIDIHILCDEKLGVCAEIEVAAGTELEKVYLSIVHELQEYFSPLPKFYTLEQLLTEKKRTIDEAFAGRPYGLTESHGFVDTEEFESLEMRRKLHLSDLYSLLQKVSGVERVMKLKFKKCGAPGQIGWDYPLPQWHTARLDMSCTNITFITDGLTLPFDQKIYADLINLNFSVNGKILHTAPSPELDSVVPKGIYRADLLQYIPLQNEFPKVYGITEGSLPQSATLERQSWSLQFRGYLLFFDQLLANYLSQLKNTQSLFSFAPPGKNQRHTYFSNKIEMPGLQELARFNVEDGGSSFMGDKGSTVAFPVNKKDFLSQLDAGTFDLRTAKAFTYKTTAECKVAVNQLLNDISQDEYQFKFVSWKENCIYYYLLTGSEDIAIIGKKYFNSQAEAKRVTETLRYIGGFHENYRVFITAEKEFSFNVEMNLFDYSRYLDQITENDEEYMGRRKVFLDHLLLRFAEQFSDYAILSFKSQVKKDTREQNNSIRENYLSNYDSLSSNRGRAYDYLKDGWNNQNISGYEKRVKALLGAPSWGRQALCNFEVVRHPEEYIVSFSAAGKPFYESKEKFSSRKEAAEAANTLLEGLTEPRHSVEPVAYKFRPLIKKLDSGQVVYRFTGHLPAMPVQEETKAVQEAKEAALKNISKIKSTAWKAVPEQPHPEKFIQGVDYLLDDALFTEKTPAADAQNKFHAELILNKNAFTFISLEEHPSKKAAATQARLLKTLFTDKYNLVVARKSGKYYIQLKEGAAAVAQAGPFTEKEATGNLEKINELLKAHSYVIDTEKKIATIADSKVDFREQKTNIDVQSLKNELAIAADLIKLRKENNEENITALDPLSKLGLYYYRLVDKNGAYAAHRTKQAQKSHFTAADVNDAFNAAAGYNYLELLFEGDFIKKQDQRKRDWYHYQFRSVNTVSKPGAPGPKKKLVLFESVKGYKSSKEALGAYQKQFFSLLEKAMDESNYGPGKIISLKELFEQNDFPDLLGKSAVFVPEDTIKFLGDNENMAIQNLVRVVKSYPLRTLNLDKLNDECFELFKENQKLTVDCDAPCIKKEQITVYYFVLFDKDKDRDDWQSIKYYRSAAEALKAFNFFVFLLRYRNNYYIDSDCSGNYRIFIREVLAESALRFRYAEDAWGKDGILRFICAMQSRQPYHFYQFPQSPDCCHSFDVACSDGLLSHPCKYDTPEMRDKALEKIIHYWKKYAVGAFHPDGNIIKNAGGEVIAYVREKPSNSLQLKCKFSLEIIPGGANENSIDCYADWVTDYCFETIQHALTALLNYRSLLDAEANYHKVFDCHCGSYGIGIYRRLIAKDEPMQVQRKALAQTEFTPVDDVNISVAFNPQCYPTAEMACEAAQRATALVNSEGLHFLEHILLLPRTLQECSSRIPTCCDEFDDCAFVWTEETEDECRKKDPVWFLPGYDPYSFIATAVLPAWPERFRKKENRLMMEDLLRKEAPAHVMLRVLWLTPFDLCKFESYFRQWVRLQSDSSLYLEGFSLEEFIKIIFTSGFECMDDCNGCDCCTEPGPEANDCFKTDILLPEPKGNTFREQVDELYCWSSSTCPRPAFNAEDKTKYIDARASYHHETAAQLYERTGDIQAKMALSFIEKTAPRGEELESLLKLLNEPAGKLSGAETEQLVKVAVLHYMDAVSFNPAAYGIKPSELKRELENTLTHVRDTVPYHSTIYRDWKYHEVKKINPELNFLRYKNILA